jgi:hypothetical protein
MNRSNGILIRLVAACAVVVVGITLDTRAARAGVIQQIAVDVSGQDDSDSVFGITGSDITRNLFAEVSNSNPPLGSPSGRSRGAVGPNGSLGLDLKAFHGASAANLSANMVTADVLIGSDEFVNLTNRRQTVVAGALIDGGRLRIVPGATNVQITYRLTVGTFDCGMVPLLTSEIDTKLLATDTLAGARPGAVFQIAGATFTAGADGSQTLTTLGGGLGATLDAGTGTVDIPLSFPSFVLGSVESGDRFLVGYEFHLEIGPVPSADATFEEALARYSDPLSLSGRPAFTVSFQSAVPEPSSAVPGGVALLALIGLACRRKVRPSPKRRVGG